jgi:hypothetical protein
LDDTQLSKSGLLLELHIQSTAPDPPVLRSASIRLFDLNGEVNRARKRRNRASIAADVRRFGHVINKDGVLGTHTSPRLSTLPTMA